MGQQQSLVYRLRERARIRRQIPTRKSVQENKPDRISDLLEEAALELERLEMQLMESMKLMRCEDCRSSSGLGSVKCPYCRLPSTLGAVYYNQNCLGCVTRMTK